MSWYLSSLFLLGLFSTSPGLKGNNDCDWDLSSSLVTQFPKGLKSFRFISKKDLISSSSVTHKSLRKCVYAVYHIYILTCTLKALGFISFHQILRIRESWMLQIRIKWFFFTFTFHFYLFSTCYHILCARCRCLTSGMNADAKPRMVFPPPGSDHLTGMMGTLGDGKWGMKQEQSKSQFSNSKLISWSKALVYSDMIISLRWPEYNGLQNRLKYWMFMYITGNPWSSCHSNKMFQKKILTGIKRIHLEREQSQGHRRLLC